jgi:uncharacterized protein
MPPEAIQPALSSASDAMMPCTALLPHCALAGPITYTGDQLAPHWIYQQTGVLGPAVASFVGPAHVDLAHMLDWEDVRQQAPIAADQMLHFVVELFGVDLPLGIALQRLWIARIQQDLHQRTGQLCLLRTGNDLWWTPEKRKLSVAICTASTTSILMHLGFNVTRAGAPVPTIGLVSDLHCNTQQLPALAAQWANCLAEEWYAIQRASWKVRAV